MRRLVHQGLQTYRTHRRRWGPETGWVPGLRVLVPLVPEPELPVRVLLVLLWVRLP